MRGTARPVLIALGALATLPGALAADRELGQYLSSECVTCHQASGQQSAGVPAIVGWPEDQFIAVMLTYKSRDRDNATMQTIATRLSTEEIESLAAFFGGLEKRE